MGKASGGQAPGAVQERGASITPIRSRLTAAQRAQGTFARYSDGATPVAADTVDRINAELHESAHLRVAALSAPRELPSARWTS